MFEGEIHRLCEEARWVELKELLLSVMQHSINKRRSSAAHDGGTPTTASSSSRRSADSDSVPTWTLTMLQEELSTLEGPQEWTPLMIACVRAPLEVLALMCHASPRSCMIADKSGSLPLHLVCGWRGDVETPMVVQILLESSAESLCATNTWGQTPLHLFLDQSKKSDDIIDGPDGLDIDCLEVLLAASTAKEALSIADAEQRLPLHLAVSTISYIDTSTACALDLLVKQYEEACCVIDGDGNLPVHILHERVQTGRIQYKNRAVVVACMQALLKPLAAATADIQESTYKQKPPETWSQLHRMTKEYARDYDRRHERDELDDEEEQIPSPASISPSPAKMACHVSNAHGTLPIHIAAYYGATPEIMEGLCQQHPEGASMQVQWEVTMDEGCTTSYLYCEIATSLEASAQEEHQHQQEDEIVFTPSSKPSRLEDLEAIAKTDHSKNDNMIVFESDPEYSIEEFGGHEHEGLARITEEQSYASESSSRRPEVADFNKDVRSQRKVEVRAARLLEIFESGWVPQQAIVATRLSPTSKTRAILNNYLDCADILFAYDFDAVTATSGKRRIAEKMRWKRLEQRIRGAAEGRLRLSDSIVRIWSYLAMSPDKKMHLQSTGKILTGLDPESLWKLTVISRNGKDSYVSIEATGRTIAEEAEMRQANVTMNTMMKQYWFQYRLTEFLAASDALNYSTTCHQSRATGVRLLPQVPLRVTEAAWDKPPTAEATTVSPPKPWQRLDILVTPDYTHTVFISYYVDCHFGDETPEKDGVAFGGLLVVRDDNRKLRPNMTEPWGDAVVAYSKFSAVNGSLVRLSFKHIPGRTYGLWHFSKGGPGSVISVSDVRIRQMLHSCDPSGRSPLHVLLNNMVDQASNPRLNMHVSMLLAAKFGSADSIGDVPLHFALRCGVNEEILQAIILASPWALVETDKEGRTPIHAAFLLAKEEPPSLGVIRALLTPPGENAIKLKDSAGRLPIHIAAERGAGEAVLRLLVDAYQDGCYRANKSGDLPLHLLLKSGTATTTTVELLIRPIMENESICRVGGVSGDNRPLHIAAEYKCSYKVLEKLLQTYGDAAMQPRPKGEGDEPMILYPMDIFELGRSEAQEKSDSSIDSAENAPESKRAKQAAQIDVMQADLDLRSDLIFAYCPLLINPVTGTPYRKDTGRIRRLETIIRREAEQCGEDRKINRRADLTDMAKQAWIFLCTYENPEDPSDNYAGIVRRILRGLAAGAVDALAHVKNPRSLRSPNEYVKDCATQVCSVLIMSRLRFVGRYALHDEIHPVHKSETCLVMRATDYGAADDYKRIMSIYEAQEQNVEDDISDAGDQDDFPHHDELVKPTSVTMDMFLNFAEKLGVQAETAREEIVRLMNMDEVRSPSKRFSASEDAISKLDEEISAEGVKEKIEEREEEVEISKEAFTSFCTLNKLEQANGLRQVVIKFMKRAGQFHREKDVRAHINYLARQWHVVPILDDYNVDRITQSRRKDIDEMMSLREDNEGEAISSAPESKDELYALDIQEKNASVHNFALYKYAVVMPAGDRDLAEISQHEELGILQIRQYMLQVGNALKSLHNQLIIHGDLKMPNVVRFGKSLALIDFDSTCRFEAIDGTPVEYMGAGSSKFCTGVLPPEMIARIDLVSDFKKLMQYEDCWRRVSEDAKDLSLLTPDDIQTITSVIKSLVAKADVSRNLGPVRTLRDEMEDPQLGLENQDDWKDIISMALVTLSFEDLPFSLSRCNNVGEFATIWERLIFHKNLWEKVRPRMSGDGRYAYVIKTFNDLLSDSDSEAVRFDPTQLPYSRIKPSESIDVWGFGVLLFSLCSGSSLFQVGFTGNLVELDDFARLYSWDKQEAERIVRSRVDDPLAQDLLLEILVPWEDRLKDMEAVLKHPFFGSSSDLEAQQILEKHEEEQLILEETVIVKRLTTATRRKADACMERHCRILFDQEKIIIPTCVMILPYQLERDSHNDRLSVQSEVDLGLAIAIGQYFLAINKATARLSFWLTFKMGLENDKSERQLFKSRLKEWMKLARKESARDVAAHVIEEIGCGPQYIPLCAEILSLGETNAVVKEYMKDAMSAARREIAENTEKIMQCYQNQQLLYLVDEINGVPVVSSSESVDFDNAQVYPISIDQNTDKLQQTFLVFMNLSVMSATARDGLDGLASLIGLPASYGIPSSWKDREAGLVHSQKPSSIAEFAVLQEVIRRQQNVEVGNELYELEVFFRDSDPLRTFAELRRVSDGNDGNAAFWTTEGAVIRMQNEMELASLEFKLRQLKREWLEKKRVQHDIMEVVQQIKDLHQDRMVNHSENGGSVATAPVNNTSSMRRPSNGRRPSNDRRPSNGHSSRRPSNGHVPGYNSANPQGEDYRARSKKRSKRRLLPFFGVC